MLAAVAPKAIPASSVELLSVSGLAPADPSKDVPVAGMGIASWLACKSGTLDNDLARCRSLDMSIPGRDLSRRKPAGAVTTSELLLVEKALVRGLWDPFVLLGLAPILTIRLPLVINIYGTCGGISRDYQR